LYLLSFHICALFCKFLNLCIYFYFFPSIYGFFQK
jgi:hypothetical protein